MILLKLFTTNSQLSNLVSIVVMFIISFLLMNPSSVASNPTTNKSPLCSTYSINSWDMSNMWNLQALKSGNVNFSTSFSVINSWNSTVKLTAIIYDSTYLGNQHFPWVWFKDNNTMTYPISLSVGQKIGYKLTMGYIDQAYALWASVLGGNKAHIYVTCST